ncbi:MAG: bifunctional nicotinamidase/pyrazinamidase [Treponema sp.]|jgi:nicotinamidase/pyrazinamidase|nr:bifunctional nicotinamidase/pyrazinamidase [Treponema sp.]
MTGGIRHTALIEIDIQNDFCPAYASLSGEKYPDGALAVEGGDDVIEPLNKLARAFAAQGARVIATQDWHPADHVSFASAHPGCKAGDAVDTAELKGQMLWPDHCVQGKNGAAFHERLDLEHVSLIIRKGFRRKLDSYSAFYENDRKTPTGLSAFLRGLEIGTVVLGGLATDYCVFYSAMDAVKEGYKTIVLLDACRGVGYPEGSVEKALDGMKQAGVILAHSSELSAGFSA